MILRPKSGRVAHWRDGLGLYVGPRKEREGEGGEARRAPNQRGAKSLGSASMSPAAQPQVLAGDEVMSRSSMSPTEVPARLSQETVAIPAVT